MLNGVFDDKSSVWDNVNDNMGSVCVVVLKVGVAVGMNVGTTVGTTVGNGVEMTLLAWKDVVRVTAAEANVRDEIKDDEDDEDAEETRHLHVVSVEVELTTEHEASDVNFDPSQY